MLWPQSVLQYEFVSKEVKFKELSFNLFVAGELEIISSGLIPDSEAKSRLEILKKDCVLQGGWVN